MKRRKIILYITGVTLLLLLIVVFLYPVLRQTYDNQITYRLDIQNVPPQIFPPINFTSELKGLSPGNIKDSVEIALLPPLNDSASVVDIAQSIKMNDLIAIYSNGDLLRWNLESRQIIKVYDFGAAADRNSTNFSADGSRVILPGEIDGNKLYGVSLWDTEHGEQIRCFGLHCSSPNRAPVSRFLYLDPLGIWKFGTIGSGMLTVDPINEPEFSGGGISYSDCTLNSSSEDNTLVMQRITVDISDTYLAYMFDNGVVCVLELSELTRIDIESMKELDNPPVLVPYDSIRYRLSGGKANSRDLALDPTLTWLSVLTDKEMVVWSLQRLVFARQLKISISDGNDIAFDRTGKLLALGTDRGIAIYDIEQAKKITEFKVGEVTAIYFTRDNRLLIWSGKDGYVHLLGVPQD